MKGLVIQMKKVICRQILDMLRVLEQALDYTSAHPNAPDAPTVRKDSLEMLAVISEALADQPYGASVTKHLHNLSLNISAMLQNPHFDPGLYDSARDTLQQAADAFTREANLTYKILFLAHYGSVWWALDSVYKAFVQEPGCEAQILLMPNIRMLKNSVETIYEDFLTPLGYPFIEYSKYDFEAEKPDIIFSVNPYDSTCPTEFSTDRLLTHTPYLVFTPYYLLTGSSVVSDEKRMMSYFGLPMFNKAWRIIAQSQWAADCFAKFTRPKGKNVAVLGSPKLDHIVNGLAEGLAMPPQWRPKLANRKAVFMLNTHYSDLNRPNSLLRKHNILEYYLEHPEIGLIWRPHPLTDVTVKGFSAELYTYLLQLEQRVALSGNIVIDKDTDYLPAFLLSNALISSPSSIIPEYMVTGKPVWVADSYEIPQAPFDSSRCYSPQRDTSHEEFVALITAGQDPMKDERAAFVNERLLYLDGQIGERIKEYILDEYENTEFA